MAVVEAAPAKVNLALHVTGRRLDGYHLLDSLVVFAGPEASDTVRAAPSAGLSLAVGGPMGADVPPGPDNLVMRAAALFDRPAALTLEKRLPAASGIGGGSADAAATLRAMAALHEMPLPEPEAVLRLGADVPVCVAGHAARMRGIGEDVEPLEGLPPLPAVLVNPGVAVSTPEVFRRLERRDNPGLLAVPGFRGVADATGWLAAQRNDLEPAALALAPQIGEALAALTAVRGCLLARMSGSGATCFGLFPDEAEARQAAEGIAASRPGWWVVATVLR